MLQLQNVKLVHLSMKRIVFGGVSGSIGILGLLFALAVYVVESLIRPKKYNVFDLYTFSPYELDIPAEAVVFPSLDGSHKVSGWYIPRLGATSTILVCPGYRSSLLSIMGMEQKSVYR